MEVERIIKKEKKTKRRGACIRMPANFALKWEQDEKGKFYREDSSNDWEGKRIKAVRKRRKETKEKGGKKSS